MIPLFVKAGSFSSEANLVNNYLKRSDGVLVVYDVTNVNSFDSISYWIKKINENIDNNKNVKIILIGNKIDLINDRKITQEKGQEVANTYNIKYFETSAKDDTGIKEAIRTIINDILESKNDENIQEPNNNDIKLIVNKENNENKNDKGNYCC